MQQSRKLHDEDSRGKDHYLELPPVDDGENETTKVTADGVVKIRPIPTYNDWIIILQSTIDTGTIEVPKSSKEFSKLEGIVIGVPAEGNGLPDNAGGRLKCQVLVGDNVMFQENSHRELRTYPGTFYADKKLIVVSERNLICRLRPIPFEVVNE